LQALVCGGGGGADPIPPLGDPTEGAGMMAVAPAGCDEVT